MFSKLILNKYWYSICLSATVALLYADPASEFKVVAGDGREPSFSVLCDNEFPSAQNLLLFTFARCELTVEHVSHCQVL